MSSAAQAHRRSSWRGQQASSKGNRWIGRVLMTLAAVVLIALFIYLFFRPRPKPELKTILVHAGSYELGAIMPPMYASTSSQQIRERLAAEEETGRSERISKFIDQDARFVELLSDPDDTVMVILRGYVLRGDDGNPVLACSDLSAGDAGAVDANDRNASADRLSGVVPIQQLLQRLCREDATPKSFAGARIVVLDIEPLAVLPRLGQFGDNIFGPLDQLVANLSGPGAEKLWVLATRGPLQNPGWNQQDKIPISTQALLDALAGEADFDDDLVVRLDELCRCIGARYNRMARSSSMPAPELALFQGQVGRVSDLSKASDTWVAKVVPPVDEPDEEEEKAVDPDPSRDGAVDATPVRFHPIAAQDQQADQSTAVTGEGGKSDATEENQGAVQPDGDTSEVIEPKAPDNFWDVRDRLESVASSEPQTHLHPIAVAPQLWRKLVQDVLHAEIESLDPLAPQSRAEFSASVTANMLAIEQSMSSDRVSLIAGDDAREIPQQIQKLWQRVVADRRVAPADDQVKAADQLQWAIAVGRMRQWSQTLYQYQALIGGGDSFSEDARLGQSLDEAERVLMGQSGSLVDVQAMRRAAQRIGDVLESVDQSVEEKLGQLKDDFGRASDANSWAVIRRAHAWLRSPLPTGPQRRSLFDSLDNLALETVNKELLKTGATSVVLSELSADRGLLALTGQIEAEYNNRQRLADHTTLSGGGFEQAYPMSVQIDPLDVQPDSVVTPLVHPVVAVPRKRQLSVTFYDASRQQVDDSVQLESTTGSLTIEIDPESKLTTQFRVTCLVNASAGEFDDQIIEATWKKSADATPDPNGKSVVVNVSRAKIGRAQLNLKVDGKVVSNVTEVPLKLQIEAINSAQDPEIRSLNGSREISVKLPLKDRIRVAVYTEGLSRPVVSGNDNLPGGAWLRTFASRETTFSLELFNESDRSAKARVWLIKLEHPFLDEGVLEYWPEVVVSQMKRLRGDVIGDDGRVLPSVLRSNRLLKGPIDIELGEGQARKPLSWLPPVNAAADAQPPTAAATDAADPSGTDVTHGLALIVRLIDNSGRMMPGQDQVLWLIPKPWPPESYVDLTKVEYVRGEVHVAAELPSDLDGDDIDDMVPGIEKTPVQLAWTENDQWEEFRFGKTTQPMSLPIELKHGLPSRGQIDVVVAKDSESIIQLDVDGWPRAILRSIAQRDGAVAERRNRFEQLRFSSVEIDYGDRIPTRSKDDDPLGPTLVYSPNPDVPVIFRGRGKSLVTRLLADITPVSFREAPPPEIEIVEGDSAGTKFWTDRSVKTIATELKDKGTISLMTTVSDLSVSWNSKAAKADADLQFRSSLNVAGVSRVATMQVTLDSTPPEIDGFRRQSGRIYVGQKVRYSIDGSDPVKGGGSSGLARVVIGLDSDGDGKPEKADKSYPFEKGSLVKVFNAPDPGRHQIAVQIWDKAGFASQPRADVLSVYEIPKPVKKPAKASPAKPSTPNTPPVPEKPKEAKRGPLQGSIDIGSTLRGTLRMSPVPEKIVPKNGVLQISGSRPSFSFGNVPEGAYTLTFKGTMQGSSKTFTWEGLNIGKTHNLPAN
jgi:hypothetical protein